MVDEFIAVQRELTARAKEADTPWRTVSLTAVFGDTYRFLITTPVENLASFDDAETSESDPELAALINRVRKCVTSRQSYAIRALPLLGRLFACGDLAQHNPVDAFLLVVVQALAVVAPDAFAD